jgi:hypothetical protein
MEKDNGKPCPEGKIRNPATGRCVNVTGKIGQSILQKQNIKRLPEDVLGIIAKKMPSKNVAKLEAVNKAFKGVIHKNFTKRESEIVRPLKKKEVFASIPREICTKELPWFPDIIGEKGIDAMKEYYGEHITLLTPDMAKHLAGQTVYHISPDILREAIHYRNLQKITFERMKNMIETLTVGELDGHILRDQWGIGQFEIEEYKTSDGKQIEYLQSYGKRNPVYVFVHTKATKWVPRTKSH